VSSLCDQPVVFGSTTSGRGRTTPVRVRSPGHRGKDHCHGPICHEPSTRRGTSPAGSLGAHVSPGAPAYLRRNEGSEDRPPRRAASAREPSRHRLRLGVLAALDQRISVRYALAGMTSDDTAGSRIAVTEDGGDRTTSSRADNPGTATTRPARDHRAGPFPTQNIGTTNGGIFGRIIDVQQVLAEQVIAQGPSGRRASRSRCATRPGR
jgi:hypothetical protein